MTAQWAPFTNPGRPPVGSTGPTATGSARMASFRDTLALLFKARFPVLYVETFEESRVVSEIGAVGGDAARIRTPRPIHTWTATQGLVNSDGSTQGGTQDAAKALDAILRKDEPAIYVFQDLHPHLGDGASRPAEPGIVRRIRDVAAAFQTGEAARVLILVSPVLRIPPELEKDITILDFPLPGEAEIRVLLDDMIANNAAGGRIRVDVDEVGRERLAKAAMGLTVHEAENAFARAMVDDGVLDNDDVRVVLEEKRQTIRKAGLLEFVPRDINLDDVGGLQNLKRWLEKRNNSWMAEAADYGLPSPKGVLMTGVPGCGKSLTAKAIASAWDLPLLRLDIGKVFAGLVGSSEQNMRSAIRSAEATAPCVLWMDEIEKGFSGVSGASGDSGTSSRVFGSFLTWMQEKTSPVFVIATANNVENLPAEFLRKGRFDEIFFVDLPTTPERADIWRLHVGKRVRHEKAARDFELTDDLLVELAEISEGYSGAEIEQAVIVGLFDAFADKRPLTATDLLRAVRNMVPLSVTQAEQITRVRQWATIRAVAATAAADRADYTTASAPAAPSAPSPGAADGNDAPSRGGRVVDF